MYVTWMQNHTTGAASFGPASASKEKLREALLALDGIKWGPGHPFSDDPPEEQKSWDWFWGSSTHGRTTYTAYIRPLVVLPSEEGIEVVTTKNGNRYVVTEHGDRKWLAYIGHSDPEREPDTSGFVRYEGEAGTRFVPEGAL